MTRKTMLWISALVVTAVIGVVLAVFQPQKLLIDKRVDEALPAVAAAPAAQSEPVAAAAPATAVATTTPVTKVPAVTSTQAAPSSPPARATPAAAISQAAAAAPAPARGGAFRSLNHPGSGTASLLQVGSAHVVRFENLAVENGPDLYVYLSPATSGSKAAAFDAGHLSLGKLKGNKGNQNYAVPAGVDLSKFKSVVVWCRRFSSGFAVAPVA